MAVVLLAAAFLCPGPYALPRYGKLTHAIAHDVFVPVSSTLVPDVIINKCFLQFVADLFQHLQSMKQLA